MKLLELLIEEVISSNSILAYHASDTSNMDEVLASKNYRIGMKGGTGGAGPGFYATLYERDVSTLNGRYVYKCRIPIDNFIILDENTFKRLKPSHFKKNVSSIMKKENLSFFGSQLMFFGMNRDEAEKLDKVFAEKTANTKGLSGSFFDEFKMNSWYNKSKGTKIKGIIFSSFKGVNVISFFPQSVVVLGRAKEIKSSAYNKFSEFKKPDKKMLLRQEKAKQASFGDTKVPKDNNYEIHKKIEKEKQRKYYNSGKR